jgi:chemotaxis protein MotB
MSKEPTIIIKKVKKVSGGHHGGAWKVAYADFVTAMMAFFLLLWLLTATPVEQLEGLADYFSPTIGLGGEMGIGFSGGKSPSTEGWSTGDWASLGLIFGAPPSGPIIKLPEDNNKADENSDVSFDTLQSEVAEAITQNDGLGKYNESVMIEQTIDGLNINITDRENRPMFKGDTAELMPHAKQVLEKIASLVKHIPNYVQIVGHTNSTFIPKSDDYTGWELSADRANAARRHLLESGLQPNQVARVVGKSDNEPINNERMDDPANSRIAITLLRKSIVAYSKQPAPDDIMLGPVKDGLKSFIQLRRKDPEQDAVGAKDEEGNPIEYEEK